VLEEEMTIEKETRRPHSAAKQPTRADLVLESLSARSSSVR
jgi:hypothetical protein